MKDKNELELSVGMKIWNAVAAQHPSLNRETMKTHKQWLDNEYILFADALKKSTVDNFMEHPQVRRMLSVDVDYNTWKDCFNFTANEKISRNLFIINDMGYPYDLHVEISGAFMRMLYYAQEILKTGATSIVEIGGGVGQFYAILRALGYKGLYHIYDLPEVKDFQDKYLKEASRRTRLYLNQDILPKADLCVSFHAFGEFDDDLKKKYVKEVIRFCSHGYIAWNPHSGASDDLSIFPFEVKVEQGREENIKIVKW